MRLRPRHAGEIQTVAGVRYRVTHLTLEGPTLCPVWHVERVAS